MYPKILVLKKLITEKHLAVSKEDRWEHFLDVADFIWNYLKSISLHCKS